MKINITFRDRLAATAPITLSDAFKYIEHSKNQSYEHAILVLAQMRYAYADQMLRTREEGIKDEKQTGCKRRNQAA